MVGRETLKSKILLQNAGKLVGHERLKSETLQQKQRGNSRSRNTVIRHLAETKTEGKWSVAKR